MTSPVPRWVLAASLVLGQFSLALPPTRTQFFALFAAYIEALRVQTGIPGMAAAIIDDQTMAWQQAFGLQDVQTATSTRTDTPFHFDGLMQLVTATLVLQCVDAGTITLDDSIRAFSPKGPYAGFTIRQILTHTSGSSDSPSFNYDLARLDALRYVVQTCKATTFRWAVAAQLERLAMMDSVPGPDAASDALPTLERATPVQAARYRNVLARLTTSVRAHRCGPGRSRRASRHHPGCGRRTHFDGPRLCEI